MDRFFDLRELCYVINKPITMKTSTKFTFLFLLAGLMAFTSCSIDDDGGDSAAGEGNLTAKVDGKTYTSMSQATTAVESTSANIEIITISGGSADSENIQINIIGFEGVGTYSLNAVSLGTYTYLQDKSDFMSAQTFSTATGAASNGEIKIAEYNKGQNVKGTFSFTGYLTSDTTKKVVVSEGDFNVKIK